MSVCHAQLNIGSRENNAIQITVVDQGHGIAETELN